MLNPMETCSYLLYIQSCKNRTGRPVASSDCREHLQAMAEPKSIRNEPMPLDMENRDPNNLNEHVRVLFEDAFAEPEGSHSIDGVWGMSYKTYNGVKGCCYIVLSILCGCPLAFCWALTFACNQCCHIWLVTPCLRLWNMNVTCMKLFWSSCIRCCYDPCYESCGLCFSFIRVTNKNG